MNSSVIEPFISAVENSQKLLSDLAEKGTAVFGYFCTYTPIEVIDACGFIPVRISGGVGEVEKASALVPDFICPFMKRSVEKVLNGEYNYLSGLIQGYSCDAACGVTNILENQLQGKVFHSIPLPYNNNPESRKFFKAAVSSLIKKIKPLGGTFSEASLKQSIEIRNGIRNQINALHDMRSKRYLPLSSSELWHVIQAGYVLPPLDYRKLLENLRQEIKGVAPYQCNGIPVLVSGSLIESVKVIDCIENSGGCLVADDLCNGQRGFSSTSDQDDEPMERLIDQHFERIPCASRSRAEDRLEHLKNQIALSRAEGVIFILQKFCTPHLSDYPYLADQLKSYGIPCMLAELDEHWNTDGQFRTRLEGFIEMLR